MLIEHLIEMLFVACSCYFSNFFFVVLFCFCIELKHWLFFRPVFILTRCDQTSHRQFMLSKFLHLTALKSFLKKKIICFETLETEIRLKWTWVWGFLRNMKIVTGFASVECTLIIDGIIIKLAIPIEIEINFF